MATHGCRRGRNVLRLAGRDRRSRIHRQHERQVLCARRQYGRLDLELPAPAAAAVDRLLRLGRRRAGLWCLRNLSSASPYKDTIIFGAPDPAPSVDGGLGSARLYSLDQATGALVWKSDLVARVNGCSFGATGEQHERIAYSSPLVHDDRVYVGIHDAGDDPIQNGKVIALDADTGHIRPAFNFEATSVRGGGIWNAPAAERDDVLFTTGNTSDGVVSEPVPNHGLSMISVEARSGAINWQFQPVPFALDDDPDWSAGACRSRGQAVDASPRR